MFLCCCDMCSVPWIAFVWNHTWEYLRWREGGEEKGGEGGSSAPDCPDTILIYKTAQGRFGSRPWREWTVAENFICFYNGYRAHCDIIDFALRKHNVNLISHDSSVGTDVLCLMYIIWHKCASDAFHPSEFVDTIRRYVHIYNPSTLCSLPRALQAVE